MLNQKLTGTPGTGWRELALCYNFLAGGLQVLGFYALRNSSIHLIVSRR